MRFVNADGFPSFSKNGTWDVKISIIIERIFGSFVRNVYALTKMNWKKRKHLTMAVITLFFLSCCSFKSVIEFNVYRFI